MVNGMGGTPLSELNIVTKYLDEQFNQNDIGVKQWFVVNLYDSVRHARLL